MKIKLLAAVLIWFCGFGNTVFAQKENYVWYFGNQAGLDFNSGTPIALMNGMINTDEGTASICDGVGNLLFYTNGVSVWDRNHNQMPNGFGLAGGTSSSQSALIVPLPGNNMLYYIFTVEQISSSSKNFSYSIVDMSLNNNDGDVTIKNNFIISPVTEKLTGVKHANNYDVWIMVHEQSTNNFYAYLVDSFGISSTPVISSVGMVPYSIGQMKFSADGTKLACASWTGTFELFDFNSSTGVVTNEKNLLLAGGTPYGVEFSENGNFLYCSFGYSHSISQWDISSNIDSVINSTLQQVGNSSASALASLQLGPDGKIYVAEHNQPALGVINNPELAGNLCNYIDSAISLNGQLCQFGLPNFITSYFLPTGINTNNPQQNQLTISPNPATDKIYISFPATVEQTITTKIFSMAGDVVYEQINKSAASITKFQIPIFNISNGIYFLSLQTGREMVTRKIVVNH